MADFDDLPGFAPPPTRPPAEFPVEEGRRKGRDHDPTHPRRETVAFRIRIRLRRAAGSSTAMLLVATLLVGGTTAITRAASEPERRDSNPVYTAPIGPFSVAPEVPEGSLPTRERAEMNRRRKPISKRQGKKTAFSFSEVDRGSSAGAGSPSQAPAPQATQRPAAGAAPSQNPSPRPSSRPHTPTAILMRLMHPNGAYFFTTSHTAAMQKEGYEGYVSERAALVWDERRGPTMLRLELSDDSVAFVYAREQDVPSGTPMPLYSASTRRYGRFYSLDRDQAAVVGSVVIYGWVARY